MVAKTLKMTAQIQTKILLPKLQIMAETTLKTSTQTIPKVNALPKHLLKHSKPMSRFTTLQVVSPRSPYTKYMFVPRAGEPLR